MKTSAEFEKFNATMKRVLSVSKVELQRRLGAERAAKKASSRVRVGKG